MKKLFTFLMMSILTIGVGWAAETVYYTLDGNQSTGGNSAPHNSYTAAAESTQDDITWSIMGNSNMTPWRIGGKSLSSVDREVYSKTAMGSAISKVSLTVGTAQYITVNSLKLIVADDENFSNKIDEVSATFAANSTIDFTPTSGTEWATGAYYKFVFTVSVSGTSNRFLQFKSATFYKNDGSAPTVATPTFSPVGGTYYEPQEVKLSCTTEGADIYWGYNENQYVRYTEPILVNENKTLYAYAMKSEMTSSEVVSATYTIASIPIHVLPYEENFSGEDRFGDFYITNEVYPGFDVWTASSYQGTNYAKANGYQNNTNNVSESWLKSPYINLTNAVAPQLSFSQAINSYFDNSNGTLWVKERSASDWTQITITYPNKPTSGYSDFVAQIIDLSAYKGQTIQIGFKYASTADYAGAWEIANFRVGEPVAEKAYYLTGTFNNWGNDSDNLQFTKVDDNTYVLRNQEITAGTTFKVKDENGAWLGGGSSLVNIDNSSFRNLALNENQAKDFCLVNAGTYDFVIKITDGVATLTVPQTTDLYLKGSFDGWGEGAKFTRNEDGSYTLENQVIEEAAEFKIYDANGAWYPGNPLSITANETTVTLIKDDGNNCSIPAGKWTFNIDIAKTTMVVSRVLTPHNPHNIFIDEDVDNGTIGIEGDKTTAVVGETITVIAIPDSGYELGKISVKKVDGEEVLGEVEVSEENTFVMPDADVLVSADFEEIEAEVGDYVKVTSTDDLTSGTYLIVYEDGSLAMDGGLTTLDAAGNSISVDILGGNLIKASAAVDAATFTYDASAGTLKSASGHYIGRTGTSNGFNESATVTYTNTITIEDGHAVITSSGGPKLQYYLSGESSRFRYYSSNQRQIQLYKKVGEVVPTLPTPEINGETPFVESTVVSIVGGTSGAQIYYTLDDSEPDANSTLYNGEFSLNATTTVKAIVIKGEEFSAVASKTFVKAVSVENIAEYKALEPGTAFAFNGNVTVTYVNGRYMYVKDNTGAALIYGDADSEFTFTQGQVLEAGWMATTKDYNGLLEAVSPSNLAATNQTVTVVPVEKNVNDITIANENEYIIVKNVSITAVTNRNFTITDASGNEIAGRTNFANVNHPEDITVNYNITCVVADYNGDVQLYPTYYGEVVEPVVLEGVSFTNGRKWATWYDDEDYAKPEGVKIYTVTGVEDNFVIVKEINYIPSQVGVLLYCEDEMSSVSAMPCEGGDGDPESILKGVVEEQVVDDCYVLYNNEFVLLQSGTKLAAHRCYLLLSELEGDETQLAPRLMIAAGGTVTAIDDLRFDRNGNPVGYYDLTGRYVGTSLSGKRGIFITSDGKKVVR